MFSNKYIISKRTWRTWIVTSNGFLVLLSALLAVCVCCLIIAFLQNVKYTGFSPEGAKQFFELTLCNLYQFVSLSTSTCDVLYQQVARDWVLGLLSIFRTIGIALLLSVIVVKLLSHKDLFVLRPVLCLAPTGETDLENPGATDFWEKKGGWELRCRLYNGTRLTLLNLKFTAKLRRPVIREDNWSLRNYTIILSTQSWAVALPFVPLSIRICLDRDDLDIQNSTLETLAIKSIQGHPFLPQLNEETAKAKSFLVINTEVSIDESDSSVVESLWWPIADKTGWYTQGHEKPINVHPGDKPLCTGTPPSKWTGWKDFKGGVTDNYVFGYGSLMGDWLGKEGSHIGNLKGYDRDWGATMDNTLSILGYKSYIPENGGEAPHYVSFLNVTKTDKKDSMVTGVINKVTLTELANLDRRERNYLRIDVTDQVKILLQDEDEAPQRPYTIWTYTASSAATVRHVEGASSGAVISEDYYRAYEAAKIAVLSRLEGNTGSNFDVTGDFELQQLDAKSY